jgi:hypothetical protein
MSDAAQQPTLTPTYYANFVTSLFTPDDLVLELRRFDRPHREFTSSGQEPLSLLPAVTPADVMRQDPIARVVMTFSAAKALKAYLDSALPPLEEARRTGTPLQ